ncbi:MAG: DNA repair protein RecO [Caldicoprobacterales bacterium]|jgi:DNA repair protein RecO (recombination protein O)|nr:DNA repair protein RecO [Clostridiales bacterium]
MRQIRTEGIVLRVKNRNESDRLLTVLSPDLGKILILARGARKPKNRFLTYSQLFCHGEIMLLPYREIYILNQTDVKNTFFDIRGDLDRLYSATYIVNLAEAIATAGENNLPLFTLLLYGLSHLSYGDCLPLDITLLTEIKILQISGFQPAILVKETGKFLDGGIPVDDDTASIIQAVLDSDLGQTYKMPLSSNVRKDLNKVLPAYIQQKLELQIQSRSYLDLFS